jgi:hypothetical protein
MRWKIDGMEAPESEVRNQRSDISGQRSEIRDQRSGDGGVRNSIFGYYHARGGDCKGSSGIFFEKYFCSI